MTYCALENYAVAARQQGRMLVQSYEWKRSGKTQPCVSPFALADQEQHRHFHRPARSGSTLPVVRY